MNITCTKENTSEFCIINNINQSTFDHEATLKIVISVLSTQLVILHSFGFWITAYRKSGLNIKRTLCCYNRDCVCLFFNYETVKKQKDVYSLCISLLVWLQNKQHWKDFQAFVGILCSFWEGIPALITWKKKKEI